MSKFREQYEQLFGPVDPYDPIDVGPFGEAVPERSALPIPGGQTPMEDTIEDTDPFTENFLALSRGPYSAPPVAPEPTGLFERVGRGLTSGVLQTGALGLGALEYGARALEDEGYTPGEQLAGDVRRTLGAGRQGLMETARSFLTPDMVESVEREILTLDPQNSIWRQSPGAVATSLVDKVAITLPSSLATLIPYAWMVRGGMAGKGIAYMGASEAGLSVGGIANGIADEIEAKTTDELLEASPRFRQLFEETGNEQAARDQLISEAQGLAPVIGGALVGVIGSIAGRYLEPVIAGQAGGLGTRVARGFGLEAAQEAPQSGIEQIAQNVAARAFDAGRTTFEGVPEATAEGALIGGLIGGGFAGVAGRRPQQALPEDVPQPEDELGPPEQPPRPEMFERVFGTGGTTGREAFDDVFTEDETFLEQRERRDAEITGVPQTGLRVTSDFVDPAASAAVAANIREADLMGDLFPDISTPEQRGPDESIERFAQDPQQVAIRNQQLDLQGAFIQPERPGARDVVPAGERRVETPPADVTPEEGGQIPAPLFRRERGVGRQPLPPRAVVPEAPEEDLSQPPGVLVDERQTDFITPREAPQRYRPPSRERPAAERRTEIVGYTAVVRDEQGNVIASELSNTFDEANEVAGQLEQQYPQGFISVEPYRERPPAAPLPDDLDRPSAEPLSDITAQLEDMQDSTSPREAVFLSADNIARLNEDELSEIVRGTGTQLADFDGRGGLMIARNREVAETLLDMRDEGLPIQTIIGAATGAGVGKPAGAEIAVQLRDDRGNVVRESLVADQAEAEALAARWTEEGRGEAVILPAQEAIARREQMIEQESRRAQRVRDIRRTRPRTAAALRAELDEEAEAVIPETETARRPEQAAARILGRATQEAQAEERTRVGGFYSPNVLEFQDPEQRKDYARLYSELVDLTLQQEMGTLEDETRRDEVLRLLARLRRRAAPRRRSERFVRAAARVSPETVAKARREKVRQAGDVIDLDQYDNIGPPPIMEREALDQLAENAFPEKRKGKNGQPLPLTKAQQRKQRVALDRIDDLFDQSVAWALGNPRNMSALMGGDALLGAVETEAVDAETGETMVERESDVAENLSEESVKERIERLGRTPGQQMKFIRRVQQRLRYRETAGAKSGAITARAEGGPRVAKRKSGYDIDVAIVDTAPYDESKADRIKREQRSKELRDQLSTSIEQSKEFLAQSLEPDSAFSKLMETQEAKYGSEIIYGRAYFRSMLDFAQMFVESGVSSPKANQEMERLIKWLDEHRTLKPETFANRMATLMKAESRESLMRIKAMPHIRDLGLNPKKRISTIEKHNKQLAQYLAEQRQIEDNWNTNAFFRNMVRPVMRAYANSILLDGWASFKPTQADLEGVKFALSRWRKVDRTRDALYKPVRNFLEKGIGLEFDKDGDLVIPTDENGNFEYRYTDTTLMRRYNKTLTKYQRDRTRAPTGGAAAFTYRWMQDRRQYEETKATARLIAGRRQQIENQVYANLAIERFQKRIGNSKVTIDGLIRAEERLIRALRELGVYQDTPSPKIGKVKLGNRTRTYRIVGPRLRNREIKKADAKRLMSQIKPEPLKLTEQEQAEFVPPASVVQERADNAMFMAEDNRSLEELVGDLHAFSEKAAIRQAARSISAGMTDGRPLRETLQTVIELLPENHPYTRTALALMERGVTDVPVLWNTREGDSATVGAYVRSRNRLGEITNPRIELNRAYFRRVRDAGRSPDVIYDTFLHAVIHEAVHVATIGELQTNTALRRYMSGLKEMARIAYEDRGLNPEDRYGLRDDLPVDEFVAEAFSNENLQRFLASVKPARENRTLWQMFKSAVMRLLGIEPTGQESLLELVFLTSDILMTNAPERPSVNRGAEETARTLMQDETLRGPYNTAIERASQTGSALRDMWRVGRQRGLQAPLPLMTQEQIRDSYALWFKSEKSGNAFVQYFDAFFKRNAENSRLMEIAEALSRKWTNLTEQTGEEAAVEFSRIATEATLYKMHADKPITDDANEHLTTDAQKERHAKLHERYNAMTPEWRKMYADLQEYYQRTVQRETALMRQNALRALLTRGDDAPMELSEFQRRFTLDKVRSLDTKEKLEAEVGALLPDENREQMLDTLTSMAQVGQMREGNYFPLMRYGDYVVYAERETERKKFADSKEAYAYASQRRKDDPTLTVGVFELEGGGFVVRSTEKDFRTAESYTEALQKRAEMVELYGEANVRDVQKKQQFQTEATIQSNAALDTILKRLEGNAAAQAAIKNFYLRSLADSSFRKHEIKRKNRKGVDYDLQHRSFTTYAKQSSYYTAQLQYGWQLGKAMTDMKTFARDEFRDQQGMTTVRLQEIIGELEKRDKMTTDHVEAPKFIRRGVELGQFMMLFSPSYWMINATQPWMVTLPWLGGKYSWGQAGAALTNAQKLIASPLVSESFNSVGGLKAFFSKAAAERSFGVLDQVIKQLRERAGDRADDYIDMLEQLRRNSVIDLSWIAELRDISEGSDLSTWQKVLDVSRIQAHLTEVNNRILTAMAAYDLKYNEALTVFEGQAEREKIAHAVAVSFAQQAVSLTQFNYSSGNKPRLFQPNGPLGPLAPWVFQFMQWPQHMYALLITNFRSAFAGASMKEKQEARRILAGVIGTHIAAGGLVGAALQPIKWAVGLAAVALGDEDDPWTVQTAASGETFDRLMEDMLTELLGSEIGGVLSRGLPTAIGTDLSDRMSLGTLYYVDLRTETAESTLGSLVASFGGPMVSLGLGWFKGAQDLVVNGEWDRAAKSVLPKIGKDIFKFYQYANEGLVNNSGDTVLPAGEIPPNQLFLQALGFQPEAVSRFYSRQSAIKDAERAVETRRNNLLQQYRSADDAAERREVLAEITEFNRRNPAARITRSSLLRAVRSKAERELRYRRYGANIRDEEAAAYSQYGRAYE